MKQFSLYKRFLLGCRVFWLYAKARRKVARLTREIDDLKRTLALTEQRYRLREDSLIDRILQAVELNGVQFAPEDVNNLLNAQVIKQSAPKSPKKSPLSAFNDLSEAEQAYCLDKKDQHFEWGREAGQDESEIEFQWNKQESQTIAEAKASGADFSSFN